MDKTRVREYPKITASKKEKFLGLFSGNSRFPGFPQTSLRPVNGELWFTESSGPRQNLPKCFLNFAVRRDKKSLLRQAPERPPLAEKPFQSRPGR